MQSLPATVLVIEKHPLMRAALVNAIADETDLTIVAIASDAGDTWKVIESLQPQIILFAIGNPGKEDLEAMQGLREHSPKAIILALTTHEVLGQEQAALAHGASAALAKTAPRAELLYVLRTMKASVKGSKENVPHVPRRDTG